MREIGRNWNPLAPAQRSPATAVLVAHPIDAILAFECFLHELEQPLSYRGWPQERLEAHEHATGELSF